MFQSNKLPPITRIILYTNIAVHLYVIIVLMNAQNQRPLSEFYENFGLIPSSFMAGSFWQPITSMFMHGIGGSMTIMHIAFNMIGVVSIGVFLEKAIGGIRFVFLYMISGIMGGMAVVYLSPDLMAPTVGASGALSGLIAAIAILMPNARVLFMFFIPMKIRTLAIGLFLISLYFGLQDGDGVISHWGHLGGLVGGFLYTLISGAKSEMKKRLGNQGNQMPSNAKEKMRSTIQNTIEELLKKSNPNNIRKPDYSAYSHKKEKEINPEEYKSSTSNMTEPTGEKKIIYDPKTGRYVIK